MLGTSESDMSTWRTPIWPSAVVASSPTWSVPVTRLPEVNVLPASFAFFIFRGVGLARCSASDCMRGTDEEEGDAAPPSAASPAVAGR